MKSFIPYILLLSVFTVITSCSSVKKANKSMEKGDYDAAFNLAVQKLSEDKFKKSNQELIPTLQTAFNKARERDLKKIKRLRKQEKSIENLKQIYALYTDLDIRQDDVNSLLPLTYNGRDVVFDLKDYSKEIEQSKTEYSDKLFSEANRLMKGSKKQARQAYQYYNDLDFVNPGYIGNLGQLIDQAKIKGSTLVLIKVENHIPKVVNKDDITELTRISESNMSNEWVIYHNKPQSGMKYDYEVTYELDHYNITPEQLNSETVQQEKQISDGWEYVYDENGNVLKDENGNDVKKEKIITVHATVKLFQQLRIAQIDGKLKIKNLHTNALKLQQPIQSEAKFENVFGVYEGDPRAIDTKYHKVLQNKELLFPKEADFVKYASADFRIKCLGTLDTQFTE